MNHIERVFTAIQHKEPDKILEGGSSLMNLTTWKILWSGATPIKKRSKNGQGR